jgi:hypothetical protein
MTTMIVLPSLAYFAGWLVCARILRRRWIRRLVTHDYKGRHYAVPEVTSYAMMGGIVWWVFLLYVLVAVPLPRYRSRKARRDASIAAMELDIHGKVI